MGRRRLGERNAVIAQARVELDRLLPIVVVLGDGLAELVDDVLVKAGVVEPLEVFGAGCVSLLVNARKYAACVSSIRVTRNRQPSAVTNDGLEPYRFRVCHGFTNRLQKMLLKPVKRRLLVVRERKASLLNQHRCNQFNPNNPLALPRRDLIILGVRLRLILVIETVVHEHAVNAFQTLSRPAVHILHLPGPNRLVHGIPFRLIMHGTSQLVHGANVCEAGKRCVQGITGSFRSDRRQGSFLEGGWPEQWMGVIVDNRSLDNALREGSLNLPVVDHFLCNLLLSSVAHETIRLRWKRQEERFRNLTYLWRIQSNR